MHASDSLTPAAPAAGTVGRRLACGATALLLGLSQSFGLYLVSSNLAGIQGSLQATAAELAWLTTAYFATALSSTLLLVKVRLHFGLRWFATLGLLGFVAVSALHLLTDSLASAVAVRAALGLAAAPLSTLAVLYMLEAMPPRLAPVGLVLGFATLQLGLPLSRVVSTDLLELGQWHGLFLPDVALAVLALAAIHAVPLVPPPRQHAFDRGDLLAFPLYAAGLALLAVVLSQGRLYWWRDAPWLGVCLAVAVACLALYAWVDLRRARPLIDLRWLVRPYMLRFVAAVLLFRIVLSEQTVGVVGLMAVLGQSNEQMAGLFTLAAGALLAGFVLALAIAARNAVGLLAVLAAALAALAAWLDADATALTRPHDLWLTQALLSMALAVFFAAACLQGFGPVMQDGGRQLVSFLAAFSAAQYMGSLLGSAWIGTVVADRQAWHYQMLMQHIRLDDPQDALRLVQLGGALRGVVGDTGRRAGQGLALLHQQVTSESFVRAYNDMFQYLAALAALMTVWLAMLAWRAKRRARAAAPAPASEQVPA